MMPWRDAVRSVLSGAAATGPAAAAIPARREPGGARDGCVSRADVEAVLASPEHVTMEFQPILDVRWRRTAGWEVLARFDGRCSPGPEQWFATAYRLGLGERLEAVTVRRTLSALRMRTPGTFISLNVSPAGLDDAGIVDLIAGSAPLTGLVLEVTEHLTPPQPGPWRDACRRLRDLGATIAIDDIGKGYAEMLEIVELHPQIIKIDKSLVDSLPDDPARRAMLRFLGLFADEVDGWLLAEGVESHAQLRALEALGVPLVQGWLVGLPDGVPRPCRADVTTARADRSFGTPSRPPSSAPATPTVATVMRPVVPGVRWSASALRVPADLSLVEAARRALTRPAERRYDDLQCLGTGGEVVGELAVHDLVLGMVDRLPWL